MLKELRHSAVNGRWPSLNQREEGAGRVSHHLQLSEVLTGIQGKGEHLYEVEGVNGSEQRGNEQRKV